MAMGALTRWRLGRQVPEDVSVVGYDDVWSPRTSVPALTTVRFEKRELAETALDLLASAIADTTPEQTVTLPVHARRARST